MTLTLCREHIRDGTLPSQQRFDRFFTTTGDTIMSQL